MSEEPVQRVPQVNRGERVVVYKGYSFKYHGGNNPYFEVEKTDTISM